MELDFMDKKNLQLFDKDMERYFLYLNQAQPFELQDAAKVAEFQSSAEKLRKRLLPIKQQDHPDVAARRAKIAEYEALVVSKGSGASQAAALVSAAAVAKPAAPAKDLTFMSKDDQYRLDRLGRELDSEQATLAAQAGTVLDSKGGEGSFHAMSKRLHGMFDLIAATENPEVKKLAARLAEYDRILGEKTALSRKKLEELGKHGDVKSVVDRYWNDFAAGGFPPSLEIQAGPDAINAWAVSIGTWRKKLDEAVAYCALAESWAPILAVDVELRNRIMRFLSERPAQFESAVASVLEPWKNDTERASSIKPASIAKDTLVNGAGEESYRIKVGIESARRLLAYQKAAGDAGSAATEKLVATLSANEKNLKTLVDRAGEEFVAETRLPEALDEPELLETAKKLIKEPYERLIVTRGLLNHTGEEVKGSFVYATDYDIFWVAAVHKLDDGSYRIWDYSFCYSRKGAPGTVFNKWVMSDNWGGRKILKENIGK
ncbi:MAG: hypothetical protein NT080_09920 [Spirochaetes bacterium]|nr:hypothetical protein [Spirochaetota bacterium]